MASPLPKYARVNAHDPEGWAQCDHCGFWRNRSDLTWQYEWGGMHLYNKGILVCFDRCYDLPQEQFRTIILPPDPPPIQNARVPNYVLQEFMIIQLNVGGGPLNTLASGGYGPQLPMVNQSGQAFITFQYPTITNTF